VNARPLGVFGQQALERDVDVATAGMDENHPGSPDPVAAQSYERRDVPAVIARAGDEDSFACRSPLVELRPEIVERPVIELTHLLRAS